MAINIRPVSVLNKLTPWSNSYPASQEITHLLWNPKFHYLVDKNMPLVPILSQINPAHTFQPYFPKIPYNNVLPFTPNLPSCDFSLGSSTKILFSFLMYPISSVTFRNTLF